MSVTLADLVARLQADVPARSGVPSTAQYTQAVKDAVNDYAQRCPMTLIMTLNVISGTASYTLPTNFLFVIKLDDFTSQDGIIHTGDGIVPLSSYWNERYTVNGQTLTFTPTPSYTLARTLRYAAGHALDGSSAYPYLTDADASILILLAQALALRKQALAAVTTVGGEITEYAIGDERVKKATPSESLRTLADTLEAEYRARVNVTAAGSRARYDWSGYLQ